jgi:hypothetical protein
MASGLSVIGSYHAGIPSVIASGQDGLLVPERDRARLRQQTDLDALVTELLVVVDRTMEPTQVSLWLRPSADGP